MSADQLLLNLLNENLVFLLLAIFIVVCILAGVRIVPQSQKFVVERLGRLRSVLGPGINFIVPFLDRVRHKVRRSRPLLPGSCGLKLAGWNWIKCKPTVPH